MGNATGVVTQAVDLADSNALQAVLAASYQVPTPAGDRLLRADYAWQDKIQFNVINDLNNRGIEGPYRWNPAR